ncbi:hypothetical protein K661_02781 [Piscirickettsia salmonis LF-89 = ATCC VR-1361]|nr:hypothetical protein [Piscirickettsia salmonis]ERL60898.1 hypothetical protein K661_02781 [Piscirickettsia salmonis LF-89 = ATCC VR-1361]
MDAVKLRASKIARMLPYHGGSASVFSSACGRVQHLQSWPLIWQPFSRQIFN